MGPRFGIKVPKPWLTFGDLVADEEYVIDFIQLGCGYRFLRPRNPGDPVPDNTVASTATLDRDQCRFAQIQTASLGEMVIAQCQGSLWMTRSESHHFFSANPEQLGPGVWVNGLKPHQRDHQELFPG